MNLAELKQLKANKEALIAEKKLQVKYTDSFNFSTIVKPVEVKEEVEKKSDTVTSEDSIDVTVVCNTAWFCDSAMDVLTDEAYTESVKARGTSIPHIADHKHSSTAHVGDVTKVYTKEISLTELGLQEKGTTTALLMESTVRKDYNADVFKFYKNNKINQHSIGLNYGEIELAINSAHEDDVKEFEVWNKYYDKIINKNLVDKRGYFWAVSKADILENSCVLFGANSLTPTLSSKTFTENIENIESTKTEIQHQPIGNTMTLEELKAKLDATETELKTLKSSVETSVVAAIKEERARCSEIYNIGATLHIPISNIKSRIERGTSLDEVKESFTELAEAYGNKTAIDTSTDAVPTTINPDSNLKVIEIDGVKVNTADIVAFAKGVK